MTALISADNAAGSTSPILVLGYESARESRNIIHDIIGGGIAVALVQPRPRKGTLELLYNDETEAFNCLNLHAEETTFTLSGADRISYNMTYVIDGSVTLSQNDSATTFTVEVGYQEVET